MKPTGDGGAFEAVGAAEEDLDRALVGVLCVVAAQRVAPGGVQERGGVVLDGGQDPVVGAPGRARTGGWATAVGGGWGDAGVAAVLAWPAVCIWVVLLDLSRTVGRRGRWARRFAPRGARSGL